MDDDVINDWVSIEENNNETIYNHKVASSLPELTRIPMKESEYQLLNNKMDRFMENINCVLLKGELNEKEIFREMQKMQQKINNLTQLITTQNEEINKLTKNISDMEFKILQKTERETNKGIRSYYKTGTPVNFIPSKTPLGKLFKE